MKNTFGHNYSVTIFGESHGEAIGCVIDGLAPGIKLDMDFIASVMEKRKAKGRISTQRKEADELHIVSGYFNGHTTGTPLTILIENTNTRSNDYEQSIGCVLLMRTILQMRNIWAGRTIAEAVISAAELLHRW